MKLEEALVSIYANRKKDIELTDVFLLYSKISDMCSDSYENKEEARLYFSLLNRINLFDCFFNKGIKKGISYLKSKYSDLSGYFSISEYKKMIDYTLISLGSSFRFPSKENKQVKPSKKTNIPVNNSNKRNINKKNKTQKKVSNIALNRKRTKKIKKDKTSIIIPFIIIAAFLFIIPFVFNWTWNEWQYVVALSSVAIVSIFSFLLILFFDKAFVDFSHSGMILSLLFTSINIILLFTFKEAYNVIFYFLSGLFLISNIAFLIHSFKEQDEGWGIVAIIGIILELFFIIGCATKIIYWTWNEWQYVVASGVTFLVLFLSLIIICFLDTELFISFINSSAIISFLFTAMNFLLYLWIGEPYKIIFCFLSTMVLLSNLGISIYSFNDKSISWGITHCVDFLINIGLMMSIFLL